MRVRTELLWVIISKITAKYPKTVSVEKNSMGLNIVIPLAKRIRGKLVVKLPILAFVAPIGEFIRIAEI